MRRIETKGSSADMKNFSERSHDNENFSPSHGQPSCSYDLREGPIEQSRACYEPLDTKREVYSMTQLGTDNSSRGETVYLSVRRRQPSGKSLINSSVQEPSRHEDCLDNTIADWERCRVFDSEGSSCVAPESKYEDDQENNQVIEDSTLEEFSISQDCPSIPELRIPMSSMDDRKFMSRGSISGSESHLKEMTTQQKRRILVSNRPCSDVNLERLNFPYGSPERGWVKMQCKNGVQEEHSPSTHTSGLPRSIRGSTSSRNSVGCASTLYRSPNMATPVEAQPDGQRKACEDGSNESNAASLRNFKEKDHERIVPSLFITCIVCVLSDPMYFQ